MAAIALLLAERSGTGVNESILAVTCISSRVLVVLEEVMEACGTALSVKFGDSTQAVV
jgi:hypothetical protein